MKRAWDHRVYSSLDAQQQPKRKAVENQVDPRLLGPPEPKEIQFIPYQPYQTEGQMEFQQLRKPREKQSSYAQSSRAAQLDEPDEPYPINTIRPIALAKNNGANAYEPLAAQFHERDEQFHVNTIRPAALAKSDGANVYGPAAENGIYQESAETGENQLTLPRGPNQSLHLHEDVQHAQNQPIRPASGDQGHLSPLPRSLLEEAKTNPIKFMAQGHLPDHDADPFARLRCFLIDFVHSPSLITSPHKSGPYFPNRCYMKEFSIEKGNLDQVVRAYGLYPEIHKLLVSINTRKDVYTIAPGYVYYSIECSVELFYDTGNPIRIPMAHGAFPEYKEKLGPVWRFQKGILVDFSALSWECMVQLLACYAEIGFHSNGMSRSGINASNLAAGIDGGNLWAVDKDMWTIVRLGGFGHTFSSLTHGGNDESFSQPVTASKETESESSNSQRS